MYQIPWIEKYRPTKLENMILDEHIYAKIKKIIEEKNMPNILIPGVPGIGKTTTVKCIAREFYGKYIDEGMLDLNASDDRGKKSVQDIGDFCKTHMDLNGRDPNDTRKYAEHKLIFLDEADNMTTKAQRLINNMMEKYQKNARFVLTCNSSSDIIEGIQSRCIILRYNRLTNEQIISRLQRICQLENISQYIITTDTLLHIANIADGDLRMAINNLQLVYRSFGNGKDPVEETDVYTICSKPQPFILKQVLCDCMNNNIINAKNKIIELKRSGFSVSDMILGLISCLKNDNDINMDIKIKYLNIICRYAYIISNGLSTDLQLIACLCSLTKVL